MRFEQIVSDERILNALEEMRFKEPTRVQEKSIPLIREGKDVMVQSETGSGKTAAFGIPIIEKTIPGKGIQALVVAPTRELAEQISSHLNKLAKGTRAKITAVYGGVALEPQERALRKADIVVGTPGRLLDHAGRKTIDLSRVQTVVLDEADRMLDMGFIQDINRILDLLPAHKQTLLFSATLSRGLYKLVSRHMNDPEEVNTRQYVDHTLLTQVYYDAQKNERFSLLAHLLKSEEYEKTIVFCNTRRDVDLVADNLRAQGIKAEPLHGGLSQSRRNKTLDNFRKGRTRVLVATDVAARGIDIDKLTHVFNYGIPRDPKEYVHRIGRTARMGSKGKVLNIITRDDYDKFARIKSRHGFKIRKAEEVNFRRVRFRTSDQRRPVHRGGFRESRRRERFPSGNQGLRLVRVS